MGSRLFQKLSCSNVQGSIGVDTKIRGDIDISTKASEIDVNDEDYAKFAKSSLSVNIVPSRKLATELPPSGQGASFILNHLENQKSYKGRIGKKEYNWKKQKKSKKNK